MEPSGVKHKLAVILAADVEGYSRLMGADEEATLNTFDAATGIASDHPLQRERVWGLTCHPVEFPAPG